MRNSELIGDLVEHLKREIGEWDFPTVGGKASTCAVFRYNIPSTQSDQAYPFVVVRLVDCEITEEGGIASGLSSVALGLGIYCKEGPEKSGKLLDELIDEVLRILRRTRLLNNKFERLLPLQVTVPQPDKQWHEFHMATIVTQWNYTIPVTPLFDAKKKRTFMDLEDANAF